VIDMAEPQRPDTPDTDQIPVQTDTRAPEAARAEPNPVAVADPNGPDLTAPAPRPASDSPVGERAYKQVRRTRFSGMWVGVTVAAVVLLILLVFIIENGQRVDISFFGAHGHLPLGVALLLAAICGVLLVAVPGYGRILQLRRALRRTTSGTGVK
jgi:uncharacterized integral membrane protein